MNDDFVNYEHLLDLLIGCAVDGEGSSSCVFRFPKQEYEIIIFRIRVFNVL